VGKSHGKFLLIGDPVSDDSIGSHLQEGAGCRKCMVGSTWNGPDVRGRGIFYIFCTLSLGKWDVLANGGQIGFRVGDKETS
jgi:hypothetical protein